MYDLVIVVLVTICIRWHKWDHKHSLIVGDR